MTGGGARRRVGSRIAAVAGLALLLGAAVLASRALAGTAQQEGRASESLPLRPPGSGSSPAVTHSGEASWTQTLWLLGVVVLGVLIGLPLLGRLLPKIGSHPTSQAVQILSQRSLGSAGLIYLVRCGPRILVLGATSSRLTTLAEISDPDEIEQVVALCSPNRAVKSHAVDPAGTQQLQNQLAELQEKIDGWKLES